MATTYTLISSNVLGSNTTTVTLSSIPSTYTDLVLRASTRDTLNQTAPSVNIRINSDSSALYSETNLQGDGSTASSDRTSNSTITYPGFHPGAASTANTFSNFEIYFPNYTVSQNKSFGISFVGENDNITAYIHTKAELYRSTAAISTLTLTCGSQFATGSSFYLYGIKNS